MILIQFLKKKTRKLITAEKDLAIKLVENLTNTAILKIRMHSMMSIQGLTLNRLNLTKEILHR